jgi:hypothetical protein
MSYGGWNTESLPHPGEHTPNALDDAGTVWAAFRFVAPAPRRPRVIGAERMVARADVVDLTTLYPDRDWSVAPSTR